MPTDADFRREIAARPADGVLRLAYADWLDEHADPRADLVRVETAMRPLPVFSDEYWELRAARAALRPRFDPAWLAEMGYGTRYEPVFAHGFPASWKERWRLTRVFTDV